MAKFHLICVNPFHNYAKGQLIKDQELIAELSEDRDHHFVRITAPPEEVKMAEPLAAEPPALPDHSGEDH